MKVEWTQPAEDQLAAIRAFWTRTSPAYATDLVERLTRRTMQLADFPDSGAIYARARPLEIGYLLEGTYRILYVVGKDHVDILGVVHTSRQLL